MNKPHILIIEDDNDIFELLQYNFEKEGFEVTHSFNGETGLNLAIKNKPNLIVLDLMLPGISGHKVCQKLKENSETKKIPIIMLSAKSEEHDKIKGLETGADDYVTKPFSPAELIARIRAVMRRFDISHEDGPQEISDEEVTQFENITINRMRHQVLIENEEVKLTLTEFKLLSKLISKPGRVFSREQLLESIAGTQTYLIDRNIDVHIRSLRKKLLEEASLIETVRGVGYRCKG